MLSFNEQASTFGKKRKRFGLCKEGVNELRLNPKSDAMYFKVLPSFDMSTAKTGADGSITYDLNSCVPSRNFEVEGAPFSQWGCLIRSYPCVGHGPLGRNGRREELISLTTFAKGNDAVYCPVAELVKVAKQYPEWAYLFETTVNPITNKEERNILSARPSTTLAVNCVLYNPNPSPLMDVSLGLIPGGGANSLLNSQTGLLNRTAANVSPDEITAEPRKRWYVQDFTDPAGGNVLMISKNSENRFYIDLAVDTNGYTIGQALPMQLLQKRYDLANPETFLQVPTAEELIDTLVKLLNQQGPNGLHEYELLKLAFGSIHKIPDPPAKNYGVGFGTNPAGPKGAAIQGGLPAGVPTNPAAVGGQPAPQNQMANPAQVQPAAQPQTRIPQSQNNSFAQAGTFGKPAVQPQAQPAVQPEAKPQAKPQAQPAVQPQAQPAVQPQAQQQALQQAKPGVIEVPKTLDSLNPPAEHKAQYQAERQVQVPGDAVDVPKEGSNFFKKLSNQLEKK